MTVNEVLKAARDLIADPANWIQYSRAKDLNGKPVSPISPEAIKFCAYGAVEHVCGRILTVFNPVISILCKYSMATTGHPSIILANDGLDHAGVLQIFDLALTAVEEHNP